MENSEQPLLTAKDGSTYDDWVTLSKSGISFAEGRSSTVATKGFGYQ